MSLRKHLPAGPPDRRQVLHGLAATSAAALTGLTPTAQAAQGKAVTNGRIRQSVVFWCFNTAGDRWDLERTCRISRDLGCQSVEIVPPENWDILRKHKLICAMAPNGMPGAPFMRGFNNLRYHEEVIERTRKAIDACAEAGFPNVIGFTGYKWRDADDRKSGEISRQDGADNCIRGLRAVAAHAEKRRVTLCIEHLNTRDDTHPMKGHPGYQGDDLDCLAAIIRKVNSPRVKLLFDIYHVQIMDGDVIPRIHQYKDYIAHVHTAGNPGRRELDDKQEINYKPIMQALVDIGYQGYVGQEFIPTRDPLQGLREAVAVCDV